MFILTRYGKIQYLQIFREHSVTKMDPENIEDVVVVNNVNSSNHQSSDITGNNVLLKDDTGASNINIRARSLKQPKRLRKIFIVLLLVALCCTYFLGMFASEGRFFDNIAKSLGYENDYHYAVIIDAGSSGTRVLAYKFRVPFIVFGHPVLDLVDEFFAQTKPGLSAYADDPDKGASTIVELIKKASHKTPPEDKKRTPLIVRATAGLRLLPPDKADNLIQHVRIAIAGLGYETDLNSVGIMSGHDEGIYIWYTVNLLHNLLGRETMAALDLGGGSTQITYQLPDQDVSSIPAQDRYIVPSGTYNITIFTHSYLKMGLYAARYGILQSEAKDQDDVNFTSVCVDPIVQGEKWTYANKDLHVSGVSQKKLSKAAVYSRCYQLVRRYTLATMDWEPKTPPAGSVAAMSFFYDVAADAGIIDVEKGGTVTVARYRAHALQACSSSNIEQPWACLDLVYLVALLQDGYKLGDDTQISLYRRIHGHEVSWALGLAYTTVLNRIAT